MSARPSGFHKGASNGVQGEMMKPFIIERRHIDVKQMKIHYVDRRGYYLCNRAIGKVIECKRGGIFTSNVYNVTCKNCRRYFKYWGTQ